jgi:hypothetical protein
VLPKAGLSASILRRNFALAYGAKSVTDPRSELGFRTDKSFAMPDGVLTLRGATGTRHSPRPPGGGNLPKTRAHHAAGANLYLVPGFAVIARGAKRRSNPLFLSCFLRIASLRSQ